MGKSIKPEMLEAAVQDILNGYRNDIDEVLNMATDHYANTAKKDIASASPVSASSPKSGQYKRGWRVQKDDRRVGTSSVVYNQINPGLTHLLEHGHATRNGSRRTFPQPHIGPAEEKVIRDFENEVKNKIRSIK